MKLFIEKVQSYLLLQLILNNYLFSISFSFFNHNYYDILVEQFSATEIIKKTDKISENKEKIMLTLLTIFFINNH